MGGSSKTHGSGGNTGSDGKRLVTIPSDFIFLFILYFIKVVHGKNRTRANRRASPGPQI